MVSRVIQLLRVLNRRVLAGVFAGCLLGLQAADSGAAAGGPLTAERQVRSFIGDMIRRHGFGEGELLGLLDDARVLPAVLKAISRPAEAKPWHEYRPIFVTPSRIRQGIRFWREHEESLDRAHAKYGVAPEVIVAIIGVETRYGRHRGSFRVLDSLATLAFRYPRRSAFFRRELESFFLLTREEQLDPRSVKGSYAGAMGLPQFIASSYREYAVDFDGDNVRDLLNSPVDAIGSVAHYLKAHGWVRGGRVAFPTRVPKDSLGGLLNNGSEPRTTLADMKAEGVQIPGELPESLKGVLIQLEAGKEYEYWVGLKNFYVITRYNHSALYAMAVHQLAEAILDQRRASVG